jgi:hypothetical protein
MGTNYYVVKNKCECCGRLDHEYHIGKSSHGWAFTFQGYIWVKLTSWQAWKKFLETQEIVDEYGDVVPYDEFVNMVEAYKAPGFVREDGHKNLQHNEEGKKSRFPRFNPEKDWDDEDGYAFTTVNFS